MIKFGTINTNDIWHQHLVWYLTHTTSDVLTSLLSFGRVSIQTYFIHELYNFWSTSMRDHNIYDFSCVNQEQHHNPWRSLNDTLPRMTSRRGRKTGVGNVLVPMSVNWYLVPMWRSSTIPSSQHSLRWHADRDIYVSDVRWIQAFFPLWYMRHCQCT
jgi:hypothetical protein